MKKVITVSTWVGPQMVEVDDRPERRFELLKVFLHDEAARRAPIHDVFKIADRILDALEAHEKARGER